MSKKLTLVAYLNSLGSHRKLIRTKWQFLTLLLLFSFSTFQSNAQIVINEIKSNGMAELANLGDSPVDISDYYFSSSPFSSRLGDLDLVCGDLNLAPGEFVTVNTFDNVDFRGGELALYTERDFRNPDAIIDYVQWGSPSRPRESVAVAAGIWSVSDFIKRFEYNQSISFIGCNGDSPDGYTIGTPSIECEGNGCNADGGVLTGGPFTFDQVGDGNPDMITPGSISLAGQAGCDFGFIVTDSEGNILGLPPMPGVVDFDGVGAGVCLIWHYGATGPVTGMELGLNANDIEGCFDLSNPVEVIRTNASGCDANGGELFGGPFIFDSVGDGTPDMIPAGAIVAANKNGDNFQYVVTDSEGYILGLPPMPSAVDFDTPGAGTCLIWCLASIGDISGLEVGLNANDIEGCHSLSNPIEVIRNNASGCNANGGELFGGPFIFDQVGDGTPDMIPDGAITAVNKNGENFAYVVTDNNGYILGLPPTPSAVDFDTPGAGTCLIWCLAYDGAIIGAEVGLNANDIEGCFSLSNPIEVIRTNASGCNANGGEIFGGPFIFDSVGDGTPDMIPAGSITSANKNGENFAWVVTDNNGYILGLPPMPSAVDFDTPGAGTCLIWCLAFDGDITGAEVGLNANDIEGCFSLSNPIEVIRTNASGCNANGGELFGGPFIFDSVGDGTPDMIPDGAITSANKNGENFAYVVTDNNGYILGLPPTPSAVDFDTPGAGTCLIWCLAYDGAITGAEVGLNANDIEGCFSLSNPIEVIRTNASGCNANGGELFGGPFIFDSVGDGTPDMIPAGSITGANKNGENFAWVVTDSDGYILGLPPMPSVVDFDAPGAGTCLIWCLAFDGDIVGAEVGLNANDLEGCFSLSNPIEVIRTNASGCDANGGELFGGPFEFDVDGTPDFIPAGSITLANTNGTNMQWVVTDDQGNILGLPPMPSVVDFDAAGPGQCYIYNVAYDDGITGLVPGENINNLGGCHSLSNFIVVTRNSTATPGVDLTVDVTVDSNTSTQFSNTTYTIEVCNEGTEIATNITVEAPFPNGMVYVGHNASAGEYELAWMYWDIPSLAPGECATLELTLFSLVNNQDVTFFTQVIGLDQMDVDSTPDNSSGTITEDDEASTTITISSNTGSKFVQSRNATAEQTQIFELSPNPVSDFTRLPINSEVELQTEIIVTDLSGKIIQTRSINILKGYNELTINTNRLIPGVYFISFSNNDLKGISKKFIKSAN